MNGWWLSRSLNSYCTESAIKEPVSPAQAELTSLVAVKDTRHSDQVQRHAELSIGLNVERLLSRQTRRKRRRGVLTASQANVGDVEELGRVRGRWKSIGVADAADEVLVYHALARPSVGG